MPEETASDLGGPNKNIKNLFIDTGNNEMDSQLKSKPHRNENAKVEDITNTNNEISTDKSSVFKIPKQTTKEVTKKAEEIPQNQAISDIEGTGMLSYNTSTANLSEFSNKSIVSNLNKSLRAKHKIINSKESHPKTSTLISEIVNTSPKVPNFSNNITSGLDSEADNASFNMLTNPTSSVVQTPTTEASLKIPNKSSKKIAKQASTRTDFFAAKLASAVDDVDSSDSDETFVYENNVNEPENQGSTNPGTLSIQNANHSVDDINVIPRNSPPNNEYKYQEQSNKAESIHSVQSSKIPPFKNTGNQHINQKPVTERSYAPSIDNSINSSNLNQENLHGKERRPSHQRSFSSHSNFFNQNTEETGRLSTVSNALSEKSHLASFYNPHFSIPEISQGNNNGIGLLDTRHGFNQANCIDDYNDPHYSYDEVEDEDEEDNIEDEEASETASEIGYYSSNLKQSATPGSTLKNGYLNNSTKNNLHQFPNLNTTNNTTNTNSINSKNQTKKKNKSSTSSKLRSTTSKLFDKRGSQPRRYSIIPDDIDIEDFDDELIYYDNNIRFPHNGSNLNESSSLINNGHRIPHYRSLNLSQNQRSPLANLKGKRYLSTGQTLIHNNMNSPDTGNSKGDIFPFPHSDLHQNYYYDIDEFDEEQQAHRLAKNRDQQYNEDVTSQFDKNQYRYGNRFSLPRKRSYGTNSRIKYIKSLMYTLISITCILSIGFVMGFLLATNKDLTNVSISRIVRPVVSEDELIFDIAVRAFNPGWFSIRIEDVELDIFAKSGYLSSEYPISGVETVLLGTVLHLDSSIEFKGGIINKDPIEHIAQIKLISPGKNVTSMDFTDDEVVINEDKMHIDGTKKNNGRKLDNSDQWEIISKNPFDLIIRGVLKYHLPLSRDTKSVIVEKVAYIDPSTPSY